MEKKDILIQIKQLHAVEKKWKLIVEKAVKSGWEPNDIDLAFCLQIDDLNNTIFSHSFCKAYFGEKKNYPFNVGGYDSINGW